MGFVAMTTAPNAKCQRVLVLALCLVVSCEQLFSTKTGFKVIHPNRLPTGHGKSWSFGRPFSRPEKLWKTAKVIESPGK